MSEDVQSAADHPFQAATLEPRSKAGRIALAVLACLGGWYYYGWIDGSFRRPATAEFAPPVFLADEVTRGIGASWRAVAVKSGDQTVLRGWLFRPAVPNGEAVLLMHETGGTRLNVRGHVPWLLRRGFTCLTPDDRGHGASGGKLVTAGLLEGADVVEWVRFLREEEGAKAVFGLGHSLGASSLLHGLALGAGLRRVVADSTGANMPTRYQLLAERYRMPVSVSRALLWPLVEPALWNARVRYGLDLDEISPVDWVRGVRVPVLLVHGQQDQYIPIEEARRVRDANPAWVTLWEVPEAGHVTAATLRPDEYQRRVLAWFDAE
jgi:pimeloyl-ACP methyl ester carboxylesterase